MKAKNITITELYTALALINDEKYNGNVDFQHIIPKGKHIDFRLRVKNSHSAGAKIGHSGRHTVAACWHVHGDFFENALQVNPKAVFITRGGPGATIDINGGNWQDCNIGSIIQPQMYSEACECS